MAPRIVIDTNIVISALKSSNGVTYNVKDFHPAMTFGIEIASPRDILIKTGVI